MENMTEIKQHLLPCRKALEGKEDMRNQKLKDKFLTIWFSVIHSHTDSEDVWHSFIQVRIIRYPHLRVVKNKVLRGNWNYYDKKKIRAAARASQGLSALNWKTDWYTGLCNIIEHQKSQNQLNASCSHSTSMAFQWKSIISIPLTVLWA